MSIGAVDSGNCETLETEELYVQVRAPISDRVAFPVSVIISGGGDVNRWWGNCVPLCHLHCNRWLLTCHGEHLSPRRVLHSDLIPTFFRSN